MEDEKTVRENTIEFYEVLLENSIKKEEYENSLKYKIILDNLKKLKEKPTE